MIVCLKMVSFHLLDIVTKLTVLLALEALISRDGGTAVVELSEYLGVEVRDCRCLLVAES